MRAGPADDMDNNAVQYRPAFSIEELLSIELREIPSENNYE
jgi:hypothetical protein